MRSGQSPGGRFFAALRCVCYIIPDNLPENSKAADVERYPRMNPSSSSDPQAIARSMLSPCCVQRAIILVIVACEYIWVAMFVGAGAQEIEATRSSRGG